MKAWLGIAVGCMLASEVAGQRDSLRRRPSEFKALPTAYYTPETRIAIEGFAYYKFYSKGADRASNVRLFAAVTQNRQILIDLPWLVFTPRERFRIVGKVDYRIFPEYYYGLGNETRARRRQLYTYQSVGFRHTAQFNVGGRWFVGLALSGRQLAAELPLLNGHRYTGTTALRGEDGYWMAGAGPSVTWDTRDFILCPQRGSFLEASLTFHRGSDAAGTLMYSSAVIDARKYFQLDSSTVFAVQGYMASTSGNIPYRELPALGGPLRHRGYYFGRFRDRHAVLAQAELRRHLFWRLGMVGFFSLGRVYDDLRQPLLFHVHPAGGGGLRFRIGKHDHTNIRFDVSFTPDSKGFYVYFAEAF